MYYIQTDEHPVRMAGFYRAIRLLSDIIHYEENDNYIQICADDNKNIFVCHLYEPNQDKITQTYTTSKSFDGIYLYSDFTGHVNTHDKHIYYLQKLSTDQATLVYTISLSDTLYSYDQCIEMEEESLFNYVMQCKSKSIMELISGERPPMPMKEV